MASRRFPTLRQRLLMALDEDRAFDDVTTGRTIPPGQRATACLVVKQSGVLAGLEAFKAVLRLVDKRVEIAAETADGMPVHPGEIVARVTGRLGAILRAERVALNLLTHLSGVATLTSRCVAACAGTRTKILDTRKTTPLWRDLEREAVAAGGGVNHRWGLADMILVKDNHVDANGGTAQALERVFRSPRPRCGVIVEARSLAEVRGALAFPVDVILLDNMTRRQIARAVQLIAGRAQVEVSGGIGERDIAPLARLGVDRISIGRLTHSAPALDFSLQIRAEAPPSPRPPE
ncbi:carboxylating nicotinate-nucleotide diphosphorylase [Candidatus Sumerlaeota bacterium]|nr:carboxylating nicotinate-nucleotide diphosphorylase [Candidatus Sumerlaeota bacterium]